MLLINILIGLVIFGAILWGDLACDLRKWRNDEPVKHGKEGMLRALVLTIPTLFFLFPVFDLSNKEILLKLGTIIGWEMFTWLLLFDGIYNIKRNFNWWFLGSVDDDAITDKIQRKIPLPLLKVLKIGIPIIFTILYIIQI